MKKEEIKQVFDNVQEQLDTLQDSGASFMFIGTEGNHFVCSGRPLDIATQIVISMIRYPVIRDIIKLQLKHLSARLEGMQRKLELSDEAIAALAQEGYDPDFGARPVKRAIQNLVLNDLSRKILADEVDRTKPIVIDEFGDGLVFHGGA